MDLEERTLKEPYEERREANGPFLCSVHAAEELPALDDTALESDSSVPGAPDPGP